MSAKGRVLSLPKGIRWRMNPGDNPFAWSEGTSFPPYPTSGDRCFRTDIRGGMLFRWNGTYWLSGELFADAFSAGPAWLAYSTFFGFGVLTTYVLPRDLDVYMVSCVIQTLVETTNDGSNFWVVDLRAGTVANSWATLGSCSGSSQSLAPNRHHVLYASAAVNVLLDTTGTADGNIHGLVGYATKTGSPGNTYHGFAFSYRLRAV